MSFPSPPFPHSFHFNWEQPLPDFRHPCCTNCQVGHYYRSLEVEWASLILRVRSELQPLEFSLDKPSPVLIVLEPFSSWSLIWALVKKPAIWAKNGGGPLSPSRGSFHPHKNTGVFLKWATIRSKQTSLTSLGHKWKNNQETELAFLLAWAQFFYLHEIFLIVQKNFCPFLLN